LQKKTGNFKAKTRIISKTLTVWGGLCLFRFCGYSSTSFASKYKFHPSFFEGIINQIITVMIKILLVEKNIILANTLKNLFNQDKQLDVIGICKEGNEVIKFLKTNPVDIILFDPNQTNGYVVTVQIKKEFPKIIIIGFSDDGTYSKDRMLEYGASSYLSKYDTTLNELITEVKKYFVE
jgi:CheY-like chemotaxis protein